MVGFLLILLKRRDMGSCVGSFDGNVDDVGGPCVGLGVGWIINYYNIDAMQINDY